MAAGGDVLDDVAQMPESRSPAPRRSRLSRTVSMSRWREYRKLLLQAREEGYTVVPLEEWLADDRRGERVLVLRHDVDQCPRAALEMLEIEQELGMRATWYFRWRTARARVIDAVKRAGGGVGLHYETLSRMVLAERTAGRSPDPGELLGAARQSLRRELIAFSVLFGAAHSACAHGDTRAPDVNNAVLLRDVDLSQYGIRYDANYSMRSHDLAVWLTDRSLADGSWRDGLDAQQILAAHQSPVLLLTHPNNWISGPGLWADRVAAALFPKARFDSMRARRTGTDTPPVS